jgi:hypothetical protein
MLWWERGAADRKIRARLFAGMPVVLVDSTDGLIGNLRGKL